ncbi:MAG: hypothetical protein ACK5Q6_12430 [Cyanobacteriota bacterium]
MDSRRVARLRLMRVFIDTLVLDAHQLAGRDQPSWFDALIAEATIRSRCSIPFSEDFSHGRRIAGLVVINPCLEPSRRRSPSCSPLVMVKPGRFRFHSPGLAVLDCSDG